LTDIKVRRTLYLTLVKSQLCYTSEVLPQKIKLEQVQRRATRWICKVKVLRRRYVQRRAIQPVTLYHESRIPPIRGFRRTKDWREYLDFVHMQGN
jgi:hypothetical protein